MLNMSEIRSPPTPMKKKKKSVTRQYKKQTEGAVWDEQTCGGHGQRPRYKTGRETFRTWIHAQEARPSHVVPPCHTEAWSGPNNSVQEKLTPTLSRSCITIPPGTNSIVTRRPRSSLWAPTRARPPGSCHQSLRRRTHLLGQVHH